MNSPWFGTGVEGVGSAERGETIIVSGFR